MNRRWVLFHLNEASEELKKLQAALQSAAVVEKEEFEIAIEHAYHHINTAWNSRSISDQEAASHSDADFIEWRQFPKELNLS